MFKLPVNVKHQTLEYVTTYEGSVGEIGVKLLQDTSFFKDSIFTVNKDDVPHDQLLRLIRHKLIKKENFKLL